MSSIGMNVYVKVSSLSRRAGVRLCLHWHRSDYGTPTYGKVWKVISPGEIAAVVELIDDMLLRQ
jgi:hypothetical protein